MPSPSLKPVIWLGDSLRELTAFPGAVQDEMGDLPGAARGEARVGYAVERARHWCLGGRLRSPRRHVPSRVHDPIRRRVFVLHAFQKKSKSGVATPKADIELIAQRLKQAIEIGRKKE